VGSSVLGTRVAEGATLVFRLCISLVSFSCTWFRLVFTVCNDSDLAVACCGAMFFVEC
jgi:hypothetical protein